MTFLRRVPFTIVLIAILLGVSMATGPIYGPSAFVRNLVGIDLDTIFQREWWSILTASFFVQNVGQLIVVVLAAAVCVGVAEWLMGTRGTVFAFVLTGLLAFAVGLGAQAIGTAAGEYWATAVKSLDTTDPLSPILGALAVASSFASVLWRRRIIILLLAFTTVFLFYSGQPSDLYRVLAVLIGMTVGAVLTRRRVHLVRWTSSHHEARVLLASVSTIFALGPVITLVSHGRFGLLSPLGMFITNGMPRGRSSSSSCSISGVGKVCTEQLGSHAGQGFSAIVLAILPLLVILAGSYGLLMGRRAAVYAVAAIASTDSLLAAFYFGVVPAIGPTSRVADRVIQSPEFAFWIGANVVVPLAFAAVLLSQRRHFSIRATALSRRRFVLTIGIALAAAFGTYLAAGWILRDLFRPKVDILDLLVDFPQRFIPLSFLLAERRSFVPTETLTRLLYHGIGPLLWTTILVALIILLRNSSSLHSRPAESTEFRRLLHEGSGSMAFPATWRGNGYWFDAGRSCAIAYRVVNGCAVTTSEPVGNPGDARDSLGQFLRFCDANAWTPVFYGIHHDWAALLVDIGWSTTVVAEETIISPAAWDMTGKKWQDVRSSINRAAREGVQVTWGTWAAFSPKITNQIAEISELWVVEKKLPELGFTLGGLDELRDSDVLLGVAIDESGHVQAVTSWMPTWSQGVLIGHTLDFMRRRADGMNGVMEFVIAEAAARAKRDGLRFLSLSGAPLAVVPNGEHETPVDRILAALGKVLEPVYGFQSLLNFKQKFQPQLAPLYMAYPDAVSLPAIAIAISRCYLPDLGLRESASLLRTLR
ncbi:DUF2156 domain-containing protein [Salinibacterium sp.]|uniref:bifunctional lysylphosphatidylglycerol flippase/synthetase MprF n=1 Tax=Salinibacterium sp. TaxID=1915057 RepID=UPI00286AE15C|nr:DUF2156 domain-containing protein [Salinibacterium sp.]